MAGRRGRQAPGGRDIWVFGYGSLMWEPGFPHTQARSALVRGYHRALCIYSHFHRGTAERPGLVLGLDFGGSCRGIAFRVAAGEARSVLAYLDERELVSYAYRRRLLPVALGPATLGSAAPGGGAVRAHVAGTQIVGAHVYVADPGHQQYAGRLAVEKSVDMVVQGVGASGTCFDYLENTVRHLDRLGIAEGPLHQLLARAVERMRETMTYEV